MPQKTWEMIVEPEEPVPVEDLRTRVEEGEGLSFPLHRAYEMNQVDQYWTDFCVKMAGKKWEDIKEAIENFDVITYNKTIRHISGINTLFRLDSASFQAGTLAMKLAFTDFKEYIGTNIAAKEYPSFRALLMVAGEEDADNPDLYFSNALSTNVAILTSDGFIPIGLRGTEVASYPEAYHVFGGKARFDNNVEQDIDFSQNAVEELLSETGVRRTELQTLDWTGISKNLQTREPETMYAASLNLTKRQFHDKWRDESPDKYEHRNIEYKSATELPSFMEETQRNFVPTGEAALTKLIQHYL